MKPPKELVDKTSVELTMLDGGMQVIDKKDKEWEIYFFKDKSKTLAAYAPIGSYWRYVELSKNRNLTIPEKACISLTLFMQGGLMYRN